MSLVTKLPIRTSNDEDFVYVNPKQYWRILHRRQQRKKLNSNKNKIIAGNKKERVYIKYIIIIKL